MVRALAQKGDEMRPSRSSAHFRSGPPILSASVGILSGGNQQKVALGKWLQLPLELVILDEPTQAIDIGTKQDLMTTIKERARGRRARGALARIGHRGTRQIRRPDHRDERGTDRAPNSQSRRSDCQRCSPRPIA